MLYVTLPTQNTRRASFYLAMEEYVARHAPSGDYLFYWQVGPSVVFGRNQVAACEVNLPYCRGHGIGVYRRKSGGGCVYADSGNIMFSFVTADDNVNATFNRYINMMVLVLRRIGVDTSATGRNDILVDGRKVSGNAFYHLPGRSIVHGTMLYDTDMENMTRSITPTGAKLESKGVESVRQRVTLLKDHTGMSIDDFKAYARRNLCDGEYALGYDDIAKIEDIERSVYLTHEFIYGKDPRHTLRRRRRIEGVGDICADMEIKGGVITGITLHGDFFAAADIEDTLLRRLKGVRPVAEDISNALPERIDHIITGLNKSDFTALLTEEENH